MTVIIGDAFSDPQSSSVGWPREIPRSKLNRPQTLHIPHMKELVRDRVQSLLIGSRVGEGAWLNDLRRRQVLHAVPRLTIAREVN